MSVVKLKKTFTDKTGKLLILVEGYPESSMEDKKQWFVCEDAVFNYVKKSFVTDEEMDIVKESVTKEGNRTTRILERVAKLDSEKPEADDLDYSDPTPKPKSTYTKKISSTQDSIERQSATKTAFNAVSNAMAGQIDNAQLEEMGISLAKKILEFIQGE